MHVLMTSDTLGGVWTYTQELVSGLIHGGHHVTLVSMGSVPSAQQSAWTSSLVGLDYRATTYRLEWMQDSARDIEDSRLFLAGLIREIKPDILHLNQYCYGDLPSSIPRIVVAHSDVVSWWVAVHGHEPPPTEWISWYRAIVTRGLNSADYVVAPSRWMLDAISDYYAPTAPGRVIQNGRSPNQFDPQRRKEDFILSVSRVWDAGKQINILAGRQQALPVCVSGQRTEPGKTSTQDGNPQFLGEQSPGQLRNLYARAAIYAATSRYEPFGLSPLEAALSRCVVLANDIPVFREVWGDAACYFRANDADDLAAAVRTLSADPQLREEFANRAYHRALQRFTAEAMVEQYEQIYASVAAGDRVA